MGSIPNAPPALAGGKRPAHFTTQVLNTLRTRLSNSKFGALAKIVAAALSFQSGRGFIGYQRLAEKLGCHVRHCIRVVKYFRQAGILGCLVRYNKAARHTTDLNRCNEYWLLPPWNDDEHLEPSAETIERHEAEEAAREAQGFSADGALETPDTPAAPVVVPFSSCGPGSDELATRDASPGPGKAPVNAPLDPDESSILAELRTFDELATVATPEEAQRVWKVARRNKKTLAQTLRAIRETADKAAGAVGSPLRRQLAAFVVSAKEVVSAPGPKTAAERTADREKQAEVERKLQERAEAERARKRAAAAALGRAPP